MFLVKKYTAWPLGKLQLVLTRQAVVLLQFPNILGTSRLLSHPLTKLNQKNKGIGRLYELSLLGFLNLFEGFKNPKFTSNLYHISGDSWMYPEAQRTPWWEIPNKPYIVGIYGL